MAGDKYLLVDIRLAIPIGIVLAHAAASARLTTVLAVVLVSRRAYTACGVKRIVLPCQEAFKRSLQLSVDIAAKCSMNGQPVFSEALFGAVRDGRCQQHRCLPYPLDAIIDTPIENNIRVGTVHIMRKVDAGAGISA